MSASHPASTVEYLPLDSIRLVPDWHYREPDPYHITVISNSLDDDDAVRSLHPLHVVPLPDGRFGLVNGQHRLAAVRRYAKQHGSSASLQVPVMVRHDLNPRDMVALRCAQWDDNIHAGLMLSNDEKKKHATWLRAMTGKSNREIARICQVSHVTVGRWFGDGTHVPPARPPTEPSKNGTEDSDARDRAKQFLANLVTAREALGNGFFGLGGFVNAAVKQYQSKSVSARRDAASLFATLAKDCAEIARKLST